MIRVMIGKFTKKIPDRVRGYVKENWGAPFIVGFMLLLKISQVSLSIGSEVIADGVAIIAYYALIVGVVLQLGYFLKCNKKNGDNNFDSS